VVVGGVVVGRLDVDVGFFVVEHFALLASETKTIITMWTNSLFENLKDIIDPYF